MKIGADLDLDSDATITVHGWLSVGYADNFGTDRLLTGTDVVVSAQTSLSNTELTADTTGVVKVMGLLEVNLAQGSIAEHIGDDNHAGTRFFVTVTINDGYT